MFLFISYFVCYYIYVFSLSLAGSLFVCFTTAVRLEIRQQTQEYYVDYDT